MCKSVDNKIFSTIAVIIVLNMSALHCQEKAGNDLHPDASYSQGILLNKPLDGFSGIWYANQPSGDEYVYKYSGGLATYTANHNPIAVYSPEVNRTYFCYGAVSETGSLIHAVSYFDHSEGAVVRPVGVLDKNTTDAHDNPVISIDDMGYIWLFSTSHGTSRPSYIHRSNKPHDISSFGPVSPDKIENGKKIPLDNFSYLQVYYQKGKGFFGLFTHYIESELKYGRKSVRVISWMTSPDGIAWSEWKDIAHIEEGHYQTSCFENGTVGTSFNYHPNLKDEPGLNYRTNLYYLQNKDFSGTWHTVDGKEVTLPLTEKVNQALVADYASKGMNVYINDLAFDRNGYPAILYITSKGYQAGPMSGPQKWNIAHWNGKSWDISYVTSSDNNYDMGSLYIEDDGTWRIIGPTEPGPQLYNTGGEMAMWVSSDLGKSWEMLIKLTDNSQYNHSYARKPLNPSEEFYALWADGHGRRPSASHLYFASREGKVYCLPEKMEGNYVMLKPCKVTPSSR
ncbi:MAG TPA: BNR-4 repeat-containing protein [Bacteroidales bacterium]|nr:BNR-4 repeat-containing protein [Bacteroidales bacterium]